MGVDTFICGNCGNNFHDIPTFLQHKSECSDTSLVLESEASNQAFTTSTISFVGEDGKPIGEDGNAQTIHLALAPPSSQPYQVAMSNEGGIHMEGIHTVTTEDGTTHEIQFLPLMEDGTTEGNDIQVIVQAPGQEFESLIKQQTVAAPSRGTGRRRGRPRKGQEKTREPPAKIKEVKPTVPEKGTDGRLLCPRCKKSFFKERHFVTHRCLGDGDYVDITKKELLGSDVEESEEEEDKEEKDHTVDIRLVSSGGRGRGRPRGRPPTRGGPHSRISAEAGSSSELTAAKDKRVPTHIQTRVVSASQLPKDATEKQTQDEGLQNATGSDQNEVKERDDGQLVSTLDSKLSSVTESGIQVVQTEENTPPIVTSREQIPDIPVFNDELEKLQFEENLNVDLSQVDTMYKTHVIDQDVNENAPLGSSRTSSELTIFSCNECDKVFMTQSHMRLHCLIHTELKPFKCHRCNYASNSKGNLYTHMRKHTGQFYRCSRCEFKTVNKGHLVEHEAIHANVRQKCELCCKDYNTLKSLINHVRKYHCNNQHGKDYLAQFLSKAGKAGTAVLHQCHVCNRKFKKKIDRDRHLFIHDIRDAPNIFVCEMCDYTASRRSYLEKHFKKHRVVYMCCECSDRFPSTIKLNQHLSQVHQCSDMDEQWMEMFQKCIDSSMFLPEPDGSLSDLGQKLNEKGDSDKAAVENLQTISESPKAPTHVQNDAENDADMKPIITETEESVNNIQIDSNDAENPVDKENIDANKDVNAQEGYDNLEVLDDELEMITMGNYNIYERLSYCHMSMEVFQKLRQTFGNEECEFCGRLFYSRSDHEPHLRTHTGDRPFACDQCSYRGITKDNLKRHIEKEHDKVTYICNQCEFVANSRTQLWHHQQKHKLTSISCPKCSVKFVSTKRLKLHLIYKHPDMNPEEVKRLTGGVQKAHGRIGRRSHKCPYCDKMFLRGSTDLQKHIWIHEGIKPFKCPLCPHACRSKNNLATHMLRHSSTKPYLCTECGKAYKSKTALRWHVRTHRDGKIFKCTKCSYEAVQKSHLTRHMETHNVVKRFVCQQCDYSANTLGYMKIHYTRNHKGMQYTYNPVVQKPLSTETKVYRCLSCDYLFGNLSDMKRHLKIRHHLQVEDIQMLENVDESQVVSSETATAEAEQPEFQVVQVSDQNPMATTTDEEDASAALQTLQYSVPPVGMDERTASAVNILQQIIDMQQQGAFSSQQQITLQSEDGQSMLVNPETIIVHQDGEEVVVSSNLEDEPPGGHQYVIQYITPDGATEEGASATQSELTQLNSGHNVLNVSEEGQPTMTDAETGQVLSVPVSMATEDQDVTSSLQMLVIPNADDTVTMRDGNGEEISHEQIITDQEQLVMHGQEETKPEEIGIESQELVQIVDDPSVVEGVQFQSEIQASEEIQDIDMQQIEDNQENEKVQMVETTLVSEEVDNGISKEEVESMDER